MPDQQISTSIIGGPKMVATELDAFAGTADSLERVAEEMSILAFSWRTHGTDVGQQASVMPGCPAATGFQAAGHETINYPALADSMQRYAHEATALSDRFRDCSTRLTEAYSGYSEVEETARRIITEGIQLTATHFPIPTLAVVGAYALGATAIGSIREGKPNASYALTETGWLQEGLVSALGATAARANILEAVLNGNIRKGSAAMGVLSTDELSEGANVVGRFTGEAYNLFQGNTIELKRVTTSKPFLDAPRTIGAAMDNLYRLGQERLGKGEGGTGLDYGTIAIQKFVNADGTVSWLVTIPGTDGKLDSPFGWPQNVELMSSDERMRMEADSARMVVDAMAQAGIGKDDSVALIGHSQGGIVAAVLASDFKDRYNFRHVVTCGSPIANHDIPKDTWVTSVENEDELVSKLDGAANPIRDTWVTIRGDVKPGSAEPGRAFESVTVPGATTNELSHAMNYLKAAYDNASAKGNHALTVHEEHFQSLVSGRLEETSYYQGRMKHDFEQDMKSLSDRIDHYVVEESTDYLLDEAKDRAKIAATDEIRKRVGDDVGQTLRRKLDDALRAVHGRK